MGASVGTVEKWCRGPRAGSQEGGPAPTERNGRRIYQSLIPTAPLSGTFSSSYHQWEPSASQRERGLAGCGQSEIVFEQPGKTPMQPPPLFSLS